jgi:hypothetical protein
MDVDKSASKVPRNKAFGREQKSSTQFSHLMDESAGENSCKRPADLPADDVGHWDIKPSLLFSIIFIKEYATGE